MTSAPVGSDDSTVQVGPFPIADLDVEELVDRLATATVERVGQPVVAYALHVGGLNARREQGFVEAMTTADFVYADGSSVVALARLAGATRIARAPTTDLAWLVLAELARRLGRPVRVALIGGPPGLAEKAGAGLEKRAPVTIVHTVDGQFKPWSPVLRAVREAQPDVTFVGLGAPLEMYRTTQWRGWGELPGGLLMTCGGWFNFVAGDEKRAPQVLQRTGFEWLARLAQSPLRLGPRYARGAAVTAMLVPRQLKQRTAASEAAR